jgi:hypothetical protein
LAVEAEGDLQGLCARREQPGEPPEESKRTMPLKTPFRLCMLEAKTKFL